MLTEHEKEALRAHFDDGQIVELSIGVALFFALSKTLIGLGLEPESMPVSLLPTPGQTGSE
jgi:alkylhydroperoxidase family enzyme